MEDIERESRVSIRKGLKKDLGHCNSCSVTYSYTYKNVYEIVVGQLSLRVCPQCIKVLKNELNEVIKR